MLVIKIVEINLFFNNYNSDVYFFNKVLWDIVVNDGYGIIEIMVIGDVIEIGKIVRCVFDIIDVEIFLNL